VDPLVGCVWGTWCRELRQAGPRSSKVQFRYTSAHAAGCAVLHAIEVTGSGWGGGIVGLAGGAAASLVVGASCLAPAKAIRLE
jgi:hypothetical protein